VLPDYQGIGVGTQLLNFVAKLYTTQTKLPFYIVTSNPQLIRSNLKEWRITRLGHASRGKADTAINQAIMSSISRKRITATLEYKKQTAR